MAKKSEKPAEPVEEVAATEPEVEAEAAAAEDNDPRAAFLAALEAKKHRHANAATPGTSGAKGKSAKSGPDAGRRMFQRRSGSA